MLLVAVPVASLLLYSSKSFCMQILLTRKCMQTISIDTHRITTSSNATPWHSYSCSYTGTWNWRHAILVYIWCRWCDVLWCYFWRNKTNSKIKHATLLSHPKLWFEIKSFISLWITSKLLKSLASCNNYIHVVYIHNILYGVSHFFVSPHAGELLQMLLFHCYKCILLLVKQPHQCTHCSTMYIHCLNGSIGCTVGGNGFQCLHYT